MKFIPTKCTLMCCATGNRFEDKGWQLEGTVNKEDIIMLNVTGGGEEPAESIIRDIENLFLKQ